MCVCDYFILFQHKRDCLPEERKAPTLIILSTQHDVRVKFNKLNSVMTGKQNLRNNWMHVLRGRSHVLGLTDQAFALEETSRYDRLNSRGRSQISLSLLHILHLFVWLCVLFSVFCIGLVRYQDQIPFSLRAPSHSLSPSGHHRPHPNPYRPLWTRASVWVCLRLIALTSGITPSHSAVPTGLPQKKKKNPTLYTHHKRKK